MIRILVAMEREAESLGVPCEVIGIGAADLPETSGEDILVNIGYCGAAGLPPGSIVAPDEVRAYGDNTGKILRTHFPCRHVTCFTAQEFVEKPCSEGASVYDMELDKVAGLPHRDLYVLKIVSDNLDEAACEAFNDEGSWEKARRLLRSENLI